MSVNLALNLTRTAAAQGDGLAIRLDEVTVTFDALRSKARGSRPCCGGGRRAW